MERLHLGPIAGWFHPASKPVANLLLIHGLSEHSGRHLKTISALNESSINVVRFDLRGAGKSDGRRQHVEHFEDYVDDAGTAYNWMTRNLPPLPSFVLGHSLGGAIAIRFAAARSQQLAGLILSAPAFKTGDSIPPMKIAVGRFIARFASTVIIPKFGDPVDISRDPAEVAAFKNDPLSTHYNTVRQGTEILDTLPHTLDFIEKIVCPTFLAHGTHDRIIRIEGSFEIFQNLKVSEKDFFIAPGAYHELHNDYGKEAYFTALTNWITKRLPQSDRKTSASPETRPPTVSSPAK